MSAKSHTWGGRRRGAGRPARGPRASERHQKRQTFRASEPLHVAIRVEPDVGQLRQRDIYRALREATICAARREDFRIVHVSIQRDHVHFLIEALHKVALAKGMQGFQISAARHLNRALSKRRGKRRRGRVFSDRYRVRVLKSPRSTRHALTYVLNNWRRHGEHEAVRASKSPIDPFSSASQFEGWTVPVRELPVRRDVWPPLVVWKPKTWLLREGWRRHGRIGADEIPGALALVKERATTAS